jgi:hypothetical protein
LNFEPLTIIHYSLFIIHYSLFTIYFQGLSVVFSYGMVRGRALVPRM